MLALTWERREDMQLFKYRLLKFIYSPIRRSIRMKLMLLMLLIALLPLTIATAISYENSKKTMVKEILSQNSSKIKWVNSSLTEDLDRIDKSLTAFYYDGNVDFYLSKTDEGNALMFYGLSYFKDKLSSYYYSNYGDFEAITFYIEEIQKAYHISGEGGFSSPLIPDLLKKNINRQRNEDVNITFKGNEIYNITEYINDDNGPYVTKFYRRFEDQKLMATMIVKLNWNMFDQAFELLDIEKDNAIYFVNNEGKMIQGVYKIEPTQSEMIQLIKTIQESKSGKNYFLLDDSYVFFEQFTESTYLIKTIPKRSVSASYLKTLNSQLLIIIFTGFLILCFTISLGYSVTKPITILARSMQNIEGDLANATVNFAPQVKSNDEIKILEQSYLFMLKKIKTLIDQEFKQKIEMQSAQLMALQAQINPHFMYNTLQMIGAMAIEKESPQIYDVISAFGNMMRYNMRLEEDVVTIQEEIGNLENYLKIQQLRFDNKLWIDFEVDENIKNYKIPKLSIQPIVENCFKHGFTKKVREWRILIKIVENEETIDICVQDNGKGISKRKLEEIRDVLQQSIQTVFNYSENLGLKNIDSRVKLFFGTEYGMSIESIEGIGTQVAIKINKILTREVNHD